MSRLRCALAATLVCCGWAAPARAAPSNPADDQARSAPWEAPGVPETPTALPVEDAIARTLASKRYRFCSEPGYPLIPDETAWCPHLPRSPDPRATRCPGLLTSCRIGASAKRLAPQKPIELNLPGFGGLGRALFWTLVVAVVIGLVAWLARSGLRLPARRDGKENGEEARGADDAGEAAAAAAEIERDVDRLLARARGAAAGGDFTAAVADLHAALFRRLEGEGHVRIHASATNGDYVRELGTRAPHLAGTVREAVRDVEAAEFGAAGATEGVYLTLLGRITPIVKPGVARVAGGLTVLALWLAGSLCLLGAPGCSGPARSDWPASPSGNAAVLEFLTATGVEAHERLSPLGSLNDAKAKTPPTDIVLLPGAEMGDREWEALRLWLEDDEHTLFLASANVETLAHLPPWLAHLEILSDDDDTARAGAGKHDGDGGQVPDARTLVATDTLTGGATKAAWRGMVPGTGWVRTDIGAANALIQRGKHPYAVLVPTDAGRVIALGDERLFTNASLVVGDNAALLSRLIGYARQEGEGTGTLEMVGEDTGLVARTPMASLARGRLAPFMLQLGACLILFLLLQGRAFGRLIEPEVTRRRVFGEHVRALGTQYARARAAGRALSLYATWAVERLRERIRLPGDRSMGDLAAVVAGRTGRPLGEVARILFAAEQNPEARAGQAAPARTIAASAHPNNDGDEDGDRAAARQQLDNLRELGRLVAEVSGSGAGRVRLTSRTPTRTTGAGRPQGRKPS